MAIRPSVMIIGASIITRDSLAIVPNLPACSPSWNAAATTWAISCMEAPPKVRKRWERGQADLTATDR